MPPASAPVPPSVTSDPRFKAGRKLVTSGRAASSVALFATLVEEARTKYGDDTVESAACYYEYGNALFRAAERRRVEEEEKEGTDDGDDDGDKKPAAASAAAAEAAEQRAAAAADDAPSTSTAEKPAAGEAAGMATATAATAIPKAEEEAAAKDGSAAASSAAAAAAGAADGGDDDEGGEEEQQIDDSALALELMESAWAIYDRYVNGDQGGEAEDGAAASTPAAASAGAASSASTDEDKPYLDWCNDQLPRALTGIGDVLSSLGRHADAVDAYTRSVSLREGVVERYKEADENDNGGLEFLKARRMLSETNILVAEELLACPPGRDVVTSETGAVLVKADEMLDFCRGYYDKARDELQETVYLMGKLASSGVDLGLEKENVCFAAQMLGGVGNALADREEEVPQQQQQQQQKEEKSTAAAVSSSSAGDPPAKKQKTV